MEIKKKKFGLHCQKMFTFHLIHQKSYFYTIPQMENFWLLQTQNVLTDK